VLEQGGENVIEVEVDDEWQFIDRDASLDCTDCASGRRHFPHAANGK
jgi:hypothetical protein